MSKAYGLFYSWELLPALTVMGVFLTTVPMGTYAGFKLILGEPKKIAAKAIEYESELRNHNHGVKKRYYGHSKTASSETH
ncbi:uncharacterized protein ACA1_267830 [Acanthamoeba castellanii str. Neff]|uniref:Uncharacterized protein n=1 Tax=Acanthamoeba castellanii (strain ATCC 30010 / Neff) TaxID=1257118 RepID=L8H442_ACACF|nr:uncharacterized protein ACA1_267830 [Acanthamoeba castellanii str. Neff]ELR19483.1 hypothetical protein ACA1_267830 [Acanthamoeba castellanii str. Neff]